MLNRVEAAVRMEEPASWAASVPVLHISPGELASTTNESGKPEYKNIRCVLLYNALLTLKCKLIFTILVEPTWSNLT